MKMKSFASALELKQALAAMSANGDLKSLPVIEMGGKQYYAREKTIYVAAKLTDVISRNGNIIDPNNSASAGLTNLPTGNITQNEAYLLRGISVKFDTGATAGTTPQAGAYTTTAPKEFANGEIQITQNGAGTLFNASGADVVAVTNATSQDDKFRSIPQGVLLRPKAQFDVTVKLAGGTFTNELIRVELRAVELVEVSKA